MEYKYLAKSEHTYRFGLVVPVQFDLQELYSVKDFPLEEIIREIDHFVFQNGNPDYIWLKIPNNLKLINGIKFLIKLIKKSNPYQKIGAYINCSIVCKKIAQKGLVDCDFIAININSIEPSNYGKVNPSCANLSLDELLEGMIEFNRNYKGHLGIYTMFFSGINDNIKSINSLKNFLLEIMPDYISIGNYTGKGFEPISIEFKKTLEENFEDVPFEVIYTF